MIVGTQRYHVLLGLELEAVLSLGVWVLSIEHRSSAGAVHSPTHLGISLAFKGHFKDTVCP